MPSPFFTFNIDNFQITQTRSAHTDTVWVSVSVKTGNAPTLFAVTPKSLGNLNNGTFSTGVSCPNVVFNGTPLVFNYLIVNAGSSSAMAVHDALKSFGDTLASNPNPNLPPFASSLPFLSQDYEPALIQLNNLFKPGSCDGLVAVEQNTFTVEQMQNYTARSPYFTQATGHIGLRAGSGCNSHPSAYTVHWSMANVADLPDVRNMPLGTVNEPDTAAYTLFQAGFGYQTSGKGLYVKTQSPSPTQLSDTHPLTQPVVLTLTTTQS